MHNKFYDILSSRPTSPCVYTEEVSDGQEIIIRNISDFTLLGDQTKIITCPRYATVLTFENCENITLSNLTIGHTPHKGECAGAVLKFIECNNIALNNLELFGCGTYGLELHNTTNITMNGCHIYECTYGAMYLNSSDLIMKNTIVSDCRNLAGCLFELESSYINMVNILISENETSNCIFSLENSNIYGEAISLCNNKYSNLGWDTDSLYLYNNTHLYTYPAEINSTVKLLREDFDSAMNYISIKSEIVHSSYNEGFFSITFNAPDMKTINEYSQYFSNESNIQFGCG